MYKIFLYPRYLSYENVIPLKTDFFYLLSTERKKKKNSEIECEKGCPQKVDERRIIQTRVGKYSVQNTRTPTSHSLNATF